VRAALAIADALDRTLALKIKSIDAVLTDAFAAVS